MRTNRMHATRRLVMAAAGLALVLTAAPASLLYGQAVVADSAYIREAASMNLSEVRLGQMAEQRASNPAVKQFGKQMVAAHSTAGVKWTSLAAQHGLPATVALNSIQQQLADRLSKLSGADFDRAYMAAMVDGHEQAAGTLQRIAAAAQSAEVRQLATSSLEATQQHLSLAQQVASQVGATGAVATTTPAPTSPAPASPAPTGNAAPWHPAGAGDKNLADGHYAQELTYGHIMETRLAQIAQKRAKNSQVKQFANQVADDFAKWRDRWTDLAHKHGANPNPNMGPLHQQKITRLEKASKGNFDQVYLDIVVENLGSMLPYLQKEGRAAKSADVRNAVEEELPSVREKLSTAQRLDRQLQANAKGKEKGKSLSTKKE